MRAGNDRPRWSSTSRAAFGSAVPRVREEVRQDHRDALGEVQGVWSGLVR